MGLRKGPDSRIISRAPRDVRLLARAFREMMGLQAVERAMLAQHIDRLAVDALPRGAEAVDGRHRDHIRLRVGRFRLLYRVRDGELDVVAITSGTD